MKRFKKILSVLLVAMVLSCFVLTGCSSGKSESKVLTVGLNSDIIACDPAFAYDNNTNAVVDQITEGLLAFDQNNQLIPKLAKSWKAANPTTYVYELRNDVKFSDGTPMTADDVVFSMNRIKDKKTASYVAWMFSNVDSITKTGDYEVTVKLSKPDALWQYVPATTGGHVVSEKYCKAHPSDFGKPTGGLLGTGPYIFKSWTAGSEIVLDKNPDYWDKSTDGTRPDKLDYKIITEGTTLVSALQSGQVDCTIDAPIDQLDQLKASNSLAVTMKDSFGVDYIAFNCQKAPFDDVNVRKAIYYALDRSQINTTITKNTTSAANSVLFNKTLCSFNTDSWASYLGQASSYKYDLSKAKEYLQKSSKPNGFNCTLTCNQSSIQDSEALLIQTCLKKLNINVTINKVTEDERVSMFQGSDIKNGKRGYDMIFALWFADFPDPASDLNSLYASSGIAQGGANAGAYSNPKVDGLLDKQEVSNNPAERTKIMQQILDITSNDVPYLVLDYPKIVMITNKRLQTPDFNAMYQYNLFFKDFKFAK